MEKVKGESSSFDLYKADAIDAAKDLMYPVDVVSRLRNASTGEEITRIMLTARHQDWDDVSRYDYGRKYV